jgi:hypothetical protein
MWPEARQREEQRRAALFLVIASVDPDLPFEIRSVALFANPAARE